MAPANRYCRCGNPLARDNAGTLCAVCQTRRLRARAPEVPSEFWQAEVMGEALASGDLGELIRAYRSHPFHGQPLPQMVVAGWLHVSQTTLSRIEQGRRRLTIDDVNGFARSLGMPWALRWVHEQSSQARKDVDPISRRSLFGAGVGAAVGFSATTAPAAAREIDLVSHWMKLLIVLDRHDTMCGPHAVLGAVRHELSLIAERRQIARSQLRIDLLRVESRWSGFASWLSHDTGDVSRRDSWADRALRLAQEAGYHDMVAWMLMSKSQWATMQPDPPRAIAFADAACRAHGTSDQIRAICALSEAQAHALSNDAASCEHSLASAYALLDADTAGADDPARQDLARDVLSRPYVLADEARCWLRLRPHKAITMFEDALHLWPRDHTRDRGTRQARLALACAAANEPDRAAVEGLKALDIAQTTRSDLTLRELSCLDHQLGAYDLPAVADFREALAAL